jgi:asparagine synthase (glutamine-hydrolysing)
VCGLSGFVSLDHRPADAAVVRRMTATLRHRGPDDEGYYVDGPVALGHRRLNIIDLATGHQPIANETGTIHAMLNGEIYNYRRLAAELRERGHRFTTSSDTEVIVHAWEEYGEDCLAHFNGMFALVVWDAERQTL